HPRCRSAGPAASPGFGHHFPGHGPHRSGRRRRQHQCRHRLRPGRGGVPRRGRRVRQPRGVDHHSADRHHRHRHAGAGAAALARGALMNEAAPAPAGWLNRNVVGAGLTSLLADACYETATAIMPGFLAVLEARDDKATAFAFAALWVGLTEGLADGVSTSVKLAGAWWSERVGHRKAVVTLAYALTGAATAFFAVATAAWHVLVGRVVAWLGRGIRAPLRDAILAASVGPADRGKVFGFHRAGDTVGAVLGPLLGAWLLGVLAPHAGGDPAQPYRLVFLLALIPGLGAALAF